MADTRGRRPEDPHLQLPAENAKVYVIRYLTISVRQAKGTNLLAHVEDCDSLDSENLLIWQMASIPRIITFIGSTSYFVNAILTLCHLEWSASGDLQLEKGGRGFVPS